MRPPLWARTMTDYGLVKRLSKGVVVLQSRNYGQQVFTRARLRVKRTCPICRCVIAPGAMAYRPITNGDNRCHRICARHLDGLK